MGDDTKQLRFRNGELTAEVRMLNSQLADVRNASTHLMGHFSVYGHEQSSKIARLERMHEKTVRENLRLRAQLGLKRQKSTPSPLATKKKILRFKNKRDSLTTTVTEDSTEYITDNEYESRAAARNKNHQVQEAPTSIVDSFDSLVDLRDHEVLQPTNVVEQEVAEPAPKIERPKEIGYGLANLRTPRPVWEQDQYTSIGEDGLEMPFRPKAQLVNDWDFDVVLPSGSKLHVPMPSYSQRNRDGARPHIPKPFDQNAYSHRFNGGGNVFTDSEHRSLAGLAVFLEDMDRHELSDYWNRRSRTHPKHTAQEWSRYYDETIRPAFLKQRLPIAPSGNVITPDASQDISSAIDKTGKSSETPASMLNKPEQTLSEKIKAIDNFEAVEAIKATTDVKTLKTEDSAKAIRDIDNPQVIEKVGDVNKTVEDAENVSPTAVNIIRVEQPSFVPAEVPSSVILLQKNSTSECSYQQVVPGFSKPASPEVALQVESTHDVKVETAECKKEDLIFKPAQRLQVSKAEMEINGMLGPIPGLPALPLSIRDHPFNAFHEVVAGKHPSQQSNATQRGDPRGSRFFNLDETRSKPHDVIGDDLGLRDESRQKGGGHFSRPGPLRPHAPLKYQNNVSSAHGAVHSGYGPETIEDLFAKPKNFHADPLAFRSVIITVPPNINLVTALSRVRMNDGTLYSATYLETSKLHTSPPITTNHIILVFVSSVAAQGFVKQSAGKVIVHHVCTATNRVVFTEATLIHTATRPIPYHIQRNILENSLTRILWIHSPNGVYGPESAPVPLTAEEALHSLVRGGNGEVKTPLHAWEDENGVIKLEFASMAEAQAAWAVIKKHSQYFQTVDYGFAPDSCGSKVTLEELQAWMVELSAHIGPEQENDQAAGVFEVVLEPPSVDVRFADVYDFAANEERELRIKELKAAKYLEDLALSRIPFGDITTETVIEDTSKDSSEVGTSTEDAKSIERDITTLGSEDGPKGVMGNAMAAAGHKDDVREMEAISRELEG